jgi:hypothetical protein
MLDTQKKDHSPKLMRNEIQTESVETPTSPMFASHLKKTRSPTIPSPHRSEPGRPQSPVSQHYTFRDPVDTALATHRLHDILVILAMGERIVPGIGEDFAGLFYR